MAEFKRTHSLERYNHDVERELAMVRADIGLHDRLQASAMWRAQRNDTGKDWVLHYVRDNVTSNLIATFHVPLNVTVEQHREHIARELTRIQKLYPLQSHRMMVCHE